MIIRYAEEKNFIELRQFYDGMCKVLSGKDFLPDLFRKRLTILKIPCLGIETALAVVSTAAHKKRYPHTRTIGNVHRLDRCVIHNSNTPYYPANWLLYRFA